MAQSGIHLIDDVLPSAPLRQWVLSVPWQLRELLADQCTVVYDVTEQPMPAWVVGADPEPPEEDARGPPDDAFDGIDPPCPED